MYKEIHERNLSVTEIVETWQKVSLNQQLRNLISESLAESRD